MKIIVPHQDYNMMRFARLIANIVNRRSMCSKRDEQDERRGRSVHPVRTEDVAQVVKYGKIPPLEKLMALTAFEPNDDLFLVIPESFQSSTLSEHFSFVTRLYYLRGHLLMPKMGNTIDTVEKLAGTKYIINVGEPGSEHDLMFREIAKSKDLKIGVDVFIDHTIDTDLLKIYPSGRVGAFRMASDPYFMFTELAEITSSYFVDLNCGSSYLRKDKLTELYPKLFDVDKVKRVLRANRLSYVVLAYNKTSNHAVKRFLCIYHGLVPVLRKLDFFDVDRPINTSIDMTGFKMNRVARKFYISTGLIKVVSALKYGKQ